MQKTNNFVLNVDNRHDIIKFEAMLATTIDGTHYTRYLSGYYERMGNYGSNFIKGIVA